MEKPAISIVIPAKNGEEYIGETLSKVREQDIGEGVEIIVIDSGSKDSTLDIVRSFADVRVVQIRPEEYGHGKTRNYGHSLSEGDIVVFLNQDATPLDNSWLKELTQNLHRDDVVGAYSRQLPRPGSSPILRNELLNTLFYAAETTRLKRIEDFERYREMSGWEKHFLTAFETVSCAVKSSALSKYPFTDIVYGEDTLWAKQLMEKGFGICFEPKSVVIHSHDEYRSYANTMRNQFDRGRFMCDTFGDSMDGFNVRTALRTYRDLVKQDSQFLDQDRSIPFLKRQYWKLYSAYIRTSFMAGFYLGYNHERFPALASNLSMVEQKRAR